MPSLRGEGAKIMGRGEDDIPMHSMIVSTHIKAQSCAKNNISQSHFKVTTNRNVMRLED